MHYTISCRQSSSVLALVRLARAHTADLLAGQLAKPDCRDIGVAGRMQAVKFFLSEGGHVDALDAMREGLVCRLAVAAEEVVELDTDIAKSHAFLRCTGGALPVLSFLSKRFQLRFQVTGSRHTCVLRWRVSRLACTPNALQGRALPLLSPRVRAGAPGAGLCIGLLSVSTTVDASVLLLRDRGAWFMETCVLALSVYVDGSETALVQST